MAGVYLIRDEGGCCTSTYLEGDATFRYQLGHRQILARAIEDGTLKRRELAKICETAYQNDRDQAQASAKLGQGGISSG